MDAGTPHKSNTGQVQTLLPEGATEWDVVQSKLPVSAVQQQGDSISCRKRAATPARRLSNPPKNSLGPPTLGDASQSDTKAAAAEQTDAKDQAGSTACVAAGTGIARTTADGGSSSYADCTGPHVVRLLAHTEEGVSVQQAIINHFSECAELRSIAAGLPDDAPDHRGICKAGQLQVPGSEPSVAAAGVHGRLQDGSADRKPVAVLAVGPEGGWTPSEIGWLTKEHAFQLVTAAGGRTLDTTTAIISLVSLVGEAMIGL